MKRHLIKTMSALAVLALATGCASTPKGQKQARAEAQDRVNEASANVTYEAVSANAGCGKTECRTAVLNITPVD